MIRKAFISAATAITLLAAVSPASAALTLTPIGVSDGFNLTTFVGGYFGQYGPLAEGILPNGNVVTGSLSTDQIYVFKDVDNQTLASALIATPYTFTTGNPNYAITTAGGQVYGAQLQGGVYEMFHNDGSHTALTGPISSVTNFLGMWGDPVNGHIISASNSGLIDIDPVTGSFRVINAGLFPDGVTVSPNGNTIYVENSGTIQSYDYTSGALINTYNIGHSPDGTGVISGGKFNGDIIVNNNDGTVGLLNPSTSAFDIIASGGTRGDFVSPDRSNGTLFLSQYDQIARLACGPGCTIGGGGVPEPATWTMLILGLGALGVVSRRRRAAVAG
ncbi:MAG: proteinsorting protein [Caulobacteraceae bacterium]|nr:proteinsorting protein [Caulobacteraceae bacterium]